MKAKSRRYSWKQFWSGFASLFDLFPDPPSIPEFPKTEASVARSQATVNRLLNANYAKSQDLKYLSVADSKREMRKDRARLGDDWKNFVQY